MRYVAAYMLALKGGNNNPTEKDIQKILSSVGIDAEADKVKNVIKNLAGKDIDEVIAEGKSLLASIPSGGGVAVSGGGGGGGAAPAAEEKKEEAKKEESDEESDDDMGFGLFD